MGEISARRCARSYGLERSASRKCSRMRHSYARAERHQQQQQQQQSASFYRLPWSGAASATTTSCATDAGKEARKLRLIGLQIAFNGARVAQVQSILHHPNSTVWCGHSSQLRWTDKLANKQTLAGERKLQHCRTSYIEEGAWFFGIYLAGTGLPTVLRKKHTHSWTRTLSLAICCEQAACLFVRMPS